MTQDGKVLVTIVVPVHNEAPNVQVLVDQITKVLLPLSAEYQYSILFVDDGSTDGTLAQIKKLRETAFHINYLSFSRNFGHQSALLAGLANAAGDAIITMDGDLQHPPEYLPAMLEAFSKGADVVYMQRINMSESLKSTLGQLFYLLFNLFSGYRLVANAADFRLISNDIAKQLVALPGQGKVLRAILPTLAKKPVVLQYHEAKRANGQPSYSYHDLFVLMLNIIFKFSKAPAYSLIIIGPLLLLLSIILLTLSLAGTLIVPLFLPIVLLAISIILICTGMLGLFAISLMDQIRQTPNYIIQESSIAAP
ncbi:MAG: glycosyltransferase family 2 protein [Chitinophagales bacterium]|nr:glycosyltransferase family 2 protein [Chitinophagales bacterium]